MWCRIMWSNVSEKRADSIFTEEMEVTIFYEISIVINHTSRRHIPENGIIHNHRLGNLKSHNHNN
jgi:hypothetical protein